MLQTKENEKKDAADVFFTYSEIFETKFRIRGSNNYKRNQWPHIWFYGVEYLPTGKKNGRLAYDDIRKIDNPEISVNFRKSPLELSQRAFQTWNPS